MSLEDDIDICVDENGYFWIIDQNGLYRHELKADKYEKLRILRSDGYKLNLDEASAWI